MLKAERQQKILELLENHTYMTVAEIAETIGVSNMTIRRDISELANEEKLVKLYGGAQKIDLIEKELSTQEKIGQNIEAKKYIGSIMNRLISDGDVIYVGAGTTILYALPSIKKDNLHFITNSLIAFNYLVSNTNHKVFLTGGIFAETTEEFVGEHAEKSFDNINIDVAFAATNGIYHNNVTTSNFQEGNVQCKAFEKAKKKYVVADSSKFNKSDILTFYKVSDLDGVITDNKIDSSVLNYYQKYGEIFC